MEKYCSMLFFFIIRWISATSYHQVEFTIDVVNTCFTEMNSIVVIAGENQTLIANSKLSSSSSIVLIQNIEHFPMKLPQRVVYMQPPRLFVIMSTLENLNQLLRNLKLHPILLDVARPIIISNTNSSASDCSSARDFLFFVWAMDFLNAMYLCIDADEGPKLFTFNPYTDKAPKPWMISKVERGFQDHPWTLLEQHYPLRNHREGNELGFSKDRILLCNSFNFDRARDLGKYPVRAGFFEYKPYLNINDGKGVFEISGIDADINLMSLIRANASVQKIKFGKNAILGYVEKKTGRVVGMIANVSSGNMDLLLNSLVITDVPNTTTTFTYIPIGLTSVTKSHGTITLGMTFLSTSYFLYISFFACGIAIIVVEKFFTHQPKYIDFITVMRIILGSALIKLPDKFAAKVLLGSIMIFFVFVNSIFPGNLISSLVAMEDKKNVEELSDLNQLGYRVITPRYITELFDLRDIVNLDVRRSTFDCGKNLLRKNDACLDFDVYLKGTMNSSLLDKEIYHMPKKIFIPAYRTYLFRRNWPPSERIDNLHLKIMSSGLVEHWLESYSKDYVAKISDKTLYEPVHFRDLKIVFLLLIGGHSLSTILYVLEVVIQKWQINSPSF